MLGVARMFCTGSKPCIKALRQCAEAPPTIGISQRRGFAESLARLHVDECGSSKPHKTPLTPARYATLADAAADSRYPTLEQSSLSYFIHSIEKHHEAERDYWKEQLKVVKEERRRRQWKGRFGSAIGIEVVITAAFAGGMSVLAGALAYGLISDASQRNRRDK